MQFRSWREYIMWGRVLGSSRQWHVLCRAVNGTLQSFTIQNSLLKIPTSACTHDAKTIWALDFRTWQVDVTFGHLSTKLRIFAYQTACWLFWTNVPISHLQMFKSPFSMGAFNKETDQRWASLSIVKFAKSRWRLYYYVCGTIRGHWPLPRPRWVNKLQCLIILTSARQCSNVPTPHLAAWHRGHWAMIEPRGNMDPSGLVSQEHVDITCVGPTLTWLAFKLKLLRQLNNRKR